MTGRLFDASLFDNRKEWKNKQFQLWRNPTNMARVLVQTPSIHRSTNIRIPSNHEVSPRNENLFFTDDESNRLLDFIQKITCEPQKLEQNSTNESENELCLNEQNAETNDERSARRKKRRCSLTAQLTKIVENPTARPAIRKSLSLTDADRLVEQNDSNFTSLRFRTRRIRNRFSNEKTDQTGRVSFNLGEEKSSKIRQNGSLKNVSSIGGTKKNVRFADSIGLELTQVQYIQPLCDDFKELGWPQKTSKKVLFDLKSDDFCSKPWSFELTRTNRKPNEEIREKHFRCLFDQPIFDHSDVFLHDVWRKQIKLEQAEVVRENCKSGKYSLNGTISVTNRSFVKNVTVKYTFNSWIQIYEHQAVYRSSSNDYRNLDQFYFQIEIPNDVDRIDFVLRYCVDGEEFWDNNNGNNFTVQNEAKSSPQTTLSFPHDWDFNEMRFY